ncbi:MAG: alpha/beta hydrolase-fold protein [Capsulimonadaceae bacterium]|nr:alpha/beta hydrolase-fold protein [Capsulimonadaceae bacterium]
MKQSSPLKAASFVVALVALSVILFFNVDYVRQNVEIFLLKATGRMWTLRGGLKTHTFYSESLRQNRRVFVYTPPGYNPANTTRMYPTLYLLHGYPDFGDMGWIKYGRAPQEIDELIVQKKIPPIIVVFPNAQGIGEFGDSEYINATNPVTASRPGSQMLDFISEDLPHWVDAKYVTDGEPRHRWIGGVSTGAYGAVNIALQHPLQFGAAISLSGYYSADPSGYARPVWGYHPTAGQLLQQSPAKYVNLQPDPQWRKSYFYIGYGTRERDVYRNEADELVASLTKYGVPCTLRAHPGKHSWDQWRRELVDAVQVLADHTLPPADSVVTASNDPKH